MQITIPLPIRNPYQLNPPEAEASALIDEIKSIERSEFKNCPFNYIAAIEFCQPFKGLRIKYSVARVHAFTVLPRLCPHANGIRRDG